MKNKIGLMMFLLCLIASVASGQTAVATGTSTDDATMARLRIGYIVFKGPNVDVLIDGEIAMNAGQPLANLLCCQFTGYMYLTPGTYSVAIVPTGQGIDEALIGPVDVTLEAGHRYTLATMGQLDDDSLTPLVIDETTVLEEVRTPESKDIFLVLNNTAGATIDFDRERGGPRGIAYGDYGILNYAASGLANGYEGPCTNFVIAVNDEVIADEPEPCGPIEPAGSYIGAFIGRWPGAEEVDNSYVQGGNTSDLNVLEFLQGFSGVGAEQGGQVLSYDTFLKAVEIAGLANMLTTGGPFFLLVPTDEAFAALPEGQLDALMADPEALADLLRNHIVEGYYPVGSLSSEVYGYGPIDRTLTNMAGAELKFSNVGTWYTSINSVYVGDTQYYTTADGTRVRPIPTVLEPPSEACGEAQLAQTSSDDYATMTDLGTLPGFTITRALGVNDAGQVVGVLDNAKRGENVRFNLPTHGFLWQDGQLTDLGTLGGNDSVAFDINVAGQVVGGSRTADGQQHAFLWQDGTITDLGTLGGDESEAKSINALGQVVGLAQTGTGEWHAFLWQDGTMTDLGTLGGSFSRANSINDTGQIAGFSDDAEGNRRAFLWEGGTMRDLGTLPDFAGSLAWRINASGQVVGWAWMDGMAHAVLWDGDTVTNLGTLGGDEGLAFSINDAGLITGRASNAVCENVPRAFVYHDGVMTDLHTLVDPALGWRLELEEETDINGSGQIVGTGVVNSRIQAFLLTLPASMTGDEGQTEGGN